MKARPCTCTTFHVSEFKMLGMLLCWVFECCLVLRGWGFQIFRISGFRSFEVSKCWIDNQTGVRKIMKPELGK